MRWALVFAGVVLVGAVALGVAGEAWPAVALACIAGAAVLLDAAEQQDMRQQRAEATLRELGDDDRIAALEQQVDRLNKANVFKGLGG